MALYITPTLMRESASFSDDDWCRRIAYPIARGVASKLVRDDDMRDHLTAIAAAHLWEVRKSINCQHPQAFAFATRSARNAMLGEMRRERAVARGMVRIKEALAEDSIRCGYRVDRGGADPCVSLNLREATPQFSHGDGAIDDDLTVSAEGDDG